MIVDRGDKCMAYKPKIFTLWPFIEKVCLLLKKKNGETYNKYVDK